MALETLEKIIRKKMAEKNLSYGSLSKKVGISKTYLTDILVHGKVPTLDTMEEIAKKLGFKVQETKEYELIQLMELLIQHYPFYKDTKFKKLKEDLQEDISVIGRTINKTKVLFQSISKKKLEMSDWLDISDLSVEQKSIIFKLVNQLQTSNWPIPEHKSIDEIVGDN